MSYRSKQVDRGLKAVHILAKFLEKKYGHLSVSIHEENYSTGSRGFPDLVFRGVGIEVKRVEFLSQQSFSSSQRYHAHLGTLKILHESWDQLKSWCETNNKKAMLVAVLCWGRQKPIFLKLTKEQVDNFQQNQKHKKWFDINSWALLREGEIWR